MLADLKAPKHSKPSYRHIHSMHSMHMYANPVRLAPANLVIFIRKVLVLSLGRQDVASGVRKVYLALMIKSPSALDALDLLDTVRPVVCEFTFDPARYIPAFANVQVSTEAGGPPWTNALCDIHKTS